MKTKGPSYRKPTKTEKVLLDVIGVDARAVGAPLQEMYHRIGSMESDNKEDAANKESSAKGVYQYLTDNKAEGKNSSFEAALNRVERAYKKAGEKTPAWVKKAREHDDPRKLTRQQSDELLLADLVLGPKPTVERIKKFLVQGDTEALKELYAEVHHTDVDQNDNVRDRMEERLVGQEGGQAVEASAQIPLEGAMGNMNPAVFRDGMAPPQAQGAPLDAFRNAPPMGSGMMRTGKKYNL